LAYYRAAEIVSGDVLEIGTGVGYGVDVVAPSAATFTTIDKTEPKFDKPLPDNTTFSRMAVPPLNFPDESFDYVISFQVIEHIEADAEFVREVSRVLRKGGKFIVSTPNAPMSLTRNPWHVREYRIEELKTLLKGSFSQVVCQGIAGNERVMAYYEQNRRGVERITRFDILDLQHRLPRWILQIPYDILNRLNRRRLLAENQNLTTSITMEDYTIGQLTEQSFDLYYIATK
jgi:2-polyprenyl-3-methyl-5-hydroxy-6-metoxy-1,4-benzoquinol methylase